MWETVLNTATVLEPNELVGLLFISAGEGGRETGGEREVERGGGERERVREGGRQSGRERG